MVIFNQSKSRTALSSTQTCFGDSIFPNTIILQLQYKYAGQTVFILDQWIFERSIILSSMIAFWRKKFHFFRENETFFHFGGNSLRRVHVFLRDQKKNLPPLFWTRNGCLNTFQQKKGQKGQKNFQIEGRKKIFPSPNGQKRSF